MNQVRFTAGSLASEQGIQVVESCDDPSMERRGIRFKVQHESRP